MVRALVGGTHAGAARDPWLSIVPIAESRSSYNGLLVFAVHRRLGLARRLRHPSPGVARGAARTGLGLRLSRSEPGDAIHRRAASPSRSAASSARSSSGRARRSTCRRPATSAPARLTVELRDLIWDGLYAPVAGGVAAAADRLNRFQFLTIRRYLSLVFVALIALLSLVALWP